MTILDVVCQVRMSVKYEEPCLFYKGDYGETICFCFSESHSECGDHFRLNCCKPLPVKEQKEFLEKVQKYYDSIPSDVKINLILKQNLKVV